MPELKRRGRPRKDDKQVPVVIFVSQELATQLKKISKYHGRSRSAHLGRVLEDYCVQEADNAK
jgi:predicted transcriptional regulator